MQRTNPVHAPWMLCADKHFWPSYIKVRVQGEPGRANQSLERLHQAQGDKCDQTQGCCRQLYGRRYRQNPVLGTGRLRDENITRMSHVKYDYLMNPPVVPQ